MGKDLVKRKTDWKISFGVRFREKLFQFRKMCIYCFLSQSFLFQIYVISASTGRCSVTMGQ